METAMILTQQEWEDLAAIARVFRFEREDKDYDPGVYARRLVLANRIIEAV